VDIERVSRELDAKRALIRLVDQEPHINKKLALKTQIGSKEFGIKVDLKEMSASKDGMYVLKGGDKYTLNGRVFDSWKHLKEPSLFLPCENLSWGGGGTNVVTFLRALVPRADTLPIRYSDVAMSSSLPDVITQALEVLEPLMRLSGPAGEAGLVRHLEGLFTSDRVQAELLTRKIAAIAAGYSPELAFAVYLASLSIESVLYRPKEMQFRRNWVFSRFKSANREMNNKIILRGSFRALPNKEEKSVQKLVEASAQKVGAIVINSLQDGPMFKAAYSLCRASYKDPNFVAILAMTETTQRYARWMLKNCDRKACLPPLILVLNETEAFTLACAFKTDKTPPLEPFVTKGDFPDMKKFAVIAHALRSRFFAFGGLPRIYVTIGERGSLGVDFKGNVIYVASYTKRGAVVYDTNACGDAYCAAIALLEWAKRNGYSDVAGEKKSETDEMLYFMQVATAASYCKATNRRGRVYAAELKDLLQYHYLASTRVDTVDGLAGLSPGAWRPEFIDENFRLRDPPEARYVGITAQLNQLIR
jgi:hypothetical protein